MGFPPDPSQRQGPPDGCGRRNACDFSNGGRLFRDFGGAAVCPPDGAKLNRADVRSRSRPAEAGTIALLTAAQAARRWRLAIAAFTH